MSQGSCACGGRASTLGLFVLVRLGVWDAGDLGVLATSIGTCIIDLSLPIDLGTQGALSSCLQCTSHTKFHGPLEPDEPQQFTYLPVAGVES